MDGFHRFLTSVAGSSKEPHVAQTIVRQVRQVIEDLLAGEPYSPRLLARLQTIGDVPTGLLQKYRTGQLRGSKRYKAVTLNVFVSKLLAFLDFVVREPVYLRGLLSSDLDKIRIVLKGCLQSLTKRRIVDDNVKRIRNIGSYCSPGVLG